MAIAFRDSATSTGNGSLSITIPSTVIVGDYMLLHITAINGGTVSTPSGWTLKRTDTGNGSSGSSAISRIYERVTQGGDASSSVSPTVSGRVAASIVAYSG